MSYYILNIIPVDFVSAKQIVSHANTYLTSAYTSLNCRDVKMSRTVYVCYLVMMIMKLYILGKLQGDGWKPKVYTWDNIITDDHVARFYGAMLAMIKYYVQGKSAMQYHPYKNQ